MKKAILIIFVGLLVQQSFAQIPDDTNGRLYLLCKTWGYVQYFSQNKCKVSWDDLLNNTINQVLQSTNNDDFNTAMINMLNQAGDNHSVADQGVLPDTNLLVNTEWIQDPLFSSQVRGFLETFSSHIYPDKSNCFVRRNDGTSPGVESTEWIDHQSIHIYP